MSLGRRCQRFASLPPSPQNVAGQTPRLVHVEHQNAEQDYQPETGVAEIAAQSL